MPAAPQNRHVQKHDAMGNGLQALGYGRELVLTLTLCRSHLDTMSSGFTAVTRPQFKRRLRATKGFGSFEEAVGGERGEDFLSYTGGKSIDLG